MKEIIRDRFVVAGTGSRSLILSPNRRVVQANLEQWMEGCLGRHPDLIMMSGGAEGWDEMITLAARNLNVPYVLCIPNKGYLNYYWTKNSLTKKDRTDEAWEMLKHSEDVEYTAEDVYKTKSLYINGLHMNFVRNQRMVDLAHGFVVYNPTSAGTKDCVARIRKAGKPMKDLTA